MAKKCTFYLTAYNIISDSCFITIYTNCIEIYCTFADGRYARTFEFESLAQLNLNYEIIEKKGLLLKSKENQLKISIDYSDEGKGIITIPTIVVASNEIERILNKYDTYKITQIESIKAEYELRKKMELFKEEFISAFDTLSLLYKSIKNDADTIQMRMQNCAIDKTIYFRLIREMYIKIAYSNSVDFLFRTLYDAHFVKTLMDKMINFDLRDCQGIRVSDSKIIELIEGQLKLCVSICADDYLYQRLRDNDNEVNELIEQILDDIDEEELYSWRALRYFPVIYMHAYSFIKSLVLYKNINHFESNSELLTMYENLINNTNLEPEEIAEKLYPIYKNYYLNIFEREYSQKEFYAFIYIFDNYYKSKDNNTSSIYVDDIAKFNNSHSKDATEYRKNEYELIIAEVKQLLDNIDNSKYFELNNIPYNLNYQYIDAAYSMLYRYILKSIGHSLPSDVFFKLFDDDYIENVQRLKKKQEDAFIKLERERLLKGDLSKEKAQEYDKYSFDNITTGYEFEEYLKSIFERIGYEVEITNKSNDQGGDLIIERDGVRTVVQAKLYSSPVGNKAVQEVVSAISFYKANKGMVVTNSSYTSSAIALAEVNDITLIDGQELDRIRNAILESL